MGVLLGLMLGIGVLLVAQTFLGDPPAQRTASGGLPFAQREQERLRQAGLGEVTPVHLYAASVAAGLVVLVLASAVSGSPTIGLAFAAFAAVAPRTFVNWRRHQRVKEVRDMWPDVVDNLASGVRAGLSLPEALSALATRGPERLRPAFARFAEDYRASGHLGACLDRLKAQLADPVADRVIEAVRMAREVGGNDLGRLLRTLSTFLREDGRTRAELETRQGWTVNAARLALASPWALLALMSTRPETADAYNTGAGVVVLLVGGGLSFAGYRMMLRIGRLPEEERVLR